MPLPDDTVLDLITDALVDLTAIQQGDTLAPEDADIGFRRLRFVIDRGNVDRLLLHSITEQNFPLSANKYQYTIGTAVPQADFDQPRPTLIQTGQIIVAGLSHPLDLNTSVQWAAIREKSNVAILPTVLYCDYRWPVANLKLNPIPLCAIPTSLYLFFWEPLPQFENLTDVINLPPAYRSWLKNSLSLELALPFMKTPSDLLVQYAINAKADVRAFNAMQLAGMVSEATTGNIPQAPAPSVNPLNQAPPPPPPPQQG